MSSELVIFIFVGIPILLLVAFISSLVDDGMSEQTRGIGIALAVIVGLYVLAILYGRYKNEN